MSSYLKAIDKQYNKGKYTVEELTYFRNTYQKATPEEKKAMDEKDATPKDKKAMDEKLEIIENGSSLQISNQKTLEAILQNTSTIVNILTFYVVITIISLLYWLYALSQL